MPAVLIYLAWLLLPPPGHESAELGTTCSPNRSIWPSSPTAIPLVMGLLRRWLFLAGYRQPVAPAAFVTAMLLAIGLGLATALAMLGSGLTKRDVQDHRPPPAGHGRSLVPDCVPGALDGAVDPGAPAVDGRAPLAAAARGKSGAGFAHLPGASGHAQRSGPGLRCGPLAGPRFGDGRSPFGPRVPHLSIGPVGRPNARGIAAAAGPPLGSLVRDDPRLGLGAGGTVGQRHRPGPSPAGRRPARSSPRAGQCLCHGAARQADVSAGDLLHARDLRLDAGTLLDAAFPGCRHLHAGEELH